jgi:phosphoribosyl 1,2-cyclic phosphodiesterase
MATELTFWGVRGSTPTPVDANLGFGGNTTCIEIRNGKDRIIIDAGSGIRELGRALAAQNGPQKIDLFLTHFHWDHIQGIPFFAPLLTAGNKVTFHSCLPATELRERLERQMSNPYFTLDFNAVAAEREFCQTRSFRSGELSVNTFPLHHPQGAFGYRIESAGKVIVVATDLEHGDVHLDKVLREFSTGADVLIYDAQYTPAEYQTRKGWGHSTYAEAARVARDAQVNQLVLFHHDPTHDDVKTAQIVSETKLLFENTIAAKEHTPLIFSPG